MEDQTDIDPSLFDERYVGGPLSAAKRYHIFKDCHHIRNHDESEASVNAIEFQNLGLCTNCKKRYFAYISGDPRDGDNRTHAHIEITPTEYELFTTLVEADVLKDYTTGVETALYYFHQALGELGPIYHWNTISGRATEVIDGDDAEAVYGDLLQTDRDMAEKLIVNGWFETQQSVFRVAIVQYLNVLSQTFLNEDIDIHHQTRLYHPSTRDKIAETLDLSTTTEAHPNLSGDGPTDSEKVGVVE